MSDYKKRLETLREKIDNRKMEKAKLEERKSTLEKEREKINAQLKEQGINSQEELKTKITELEKGIDDRLTGAEKVLG